MSDMKQTIQIEQAIDIGNLRKDMANSASG